MRSYCWIRLTEIVLEVTDRVILPIGTVEAPQKAKEYTQKKARNIADAFNEGVKLWETMEDWKK